MVPRDNAGLLANLNFAEVNITLPKDSDSFKHIQKSSKHSQATISPDLLNTSNQLNRVSDLYTQDFNLSNSNEFYTLHRQLNTATLLSGLPSYKTLLDNSSVEAYKAYGLYGTPTPGSPYNLGLPTYTFFNESPAFFLRGVSFEGKKSPLNLS